MAARIYKRGNRYRIVATVNGKQREVSRKTKAEATRVKAQIDKHLAMRQFGVKEEQPKKTFKEVSIEWYALLEIGEYSPHTLSRYRVLMDKINIYIGKKPVDEITRGDVRDMILKESNKGVSRSSLNLMHTVASGIFRHALDDELIAALPTAGIMRNLKGGTKRKEINPMSEQDMQRVLKQLPKKYFDVFYFLYQTGCRLGEALALTWDDIDLVQATCSINKTTKDQVVRETTKTGVNREIPLSGSLVEVLQNKKRLDRFESVRSGIRQRYIFSEKGKIISDNTLRRHWSKACSRAGVKARRIHDIRHTCASLLLERGSGVEKVSRLLGHSSPKITWDVYSHMVKGESTDFIESISWVNMRHK